MENTNAGTTPVEKVEAGTQPVETTEETIVLKKSELESLTSAIESTQALADKKAADAENYQKGMLKYKSKYRELAGDEEEEEKPTITKEDIAEIVRNTIKETLPTIEKKDDEVEKIKIQNSELITALRNRGQVSSNTSKGSNLDKPEVNTNTYWSPEQIAELKARGLDPEKVRQNLPKAEGGAGFQA